MSVRRIITSVLLSIILAVGISTNTDSFTLTNLLKNRFRNIFEADTDNEQLSMTVVPEKHVPMESAKMELVSTEFERKSRAIAKQQHEVVFSIQQNNLDEIERILNDVSDPFSPNYGKHLTKAKVTALTANYDSANHVITYLTSKNVTISRKTRHSEYIAATTDIAQWESLFNTEFFEYQHRIKTDRVVLRAEHYSLPENIASHISAVFNTVQFPDFSYNHNKFVHVFDFNDTDTTSTAAAPHSATHDTHNTNNRINLAREQVLISGSVTPSLLNNFYNITNNTGNSLGSQGVYEAIGDYVSPVDLAAFQTRFKLPLQPIAVSIGNHMVDNACSVGQCAESHLDVQYMMAVSQVTPMTYYYWAGSDFLLQWIWAVAAMPNPAKVYSISYGTYETVMSPAYLNAFNTEAMKMGVMGGE